MKKLLRISAFFLLLPALLLTSCNDDDDASGLPKAPKNFEAKAGDGQVTLHWIAPAGDDLQEYAIEWTPGDGKASVKPKASSYTVTGLTNNVEYTFKISAVYAYGRSEVLETTIKPGNPDVLYEDVIDLKATTGYGAVDLTWKAPAADSRTTLSGYTITFEPDAEGIEQPIELDAAATSYHIDSLRNGTEYTISVVAHYTDLGVSDGATVVAKPADPITGVAVEDADFVHFDMRKHTIDVYYNKTNDLKNVVLDLTLDEGAVGGAIPEQLTFDLSGGKTGSIRITDEISYTVSAEVDLLVSALKATWNNESLVADVTIDQEKRVIVADFGDEQLDKTVVDVEMTLSENAKLVDPAENPATMNLAADTTLLKLTGKYDNEVSYKVVCKGEALFNPAAFTGVAIPANWTRVMEYNGKAIPGSIALYHMTEYNGETVNAYIVMWGKDATHTVYAKQGGAAQDFSAFKSMSDADQPVFLIAGSPDDQAVAVHNGELLYYNESILDLEGVPGAGAPTFAVESDGTWKEATCAFRMIDGKVTFCNWDTGRNPWDVKEAFGCGGFYLNPAAGGGFTSNGSSTLQSQCFFGMNDTANASVAAFFVCEHAGDAVGITQDNVCRLLISAGIRAGFPVCKKNQVGMYINGSEVFLGSEVAPRFAVGIK
ncbi:fibronectin type III domain-containing protein [uncultured Alistipes sp.]|uniref:fibronectin type III domain-containing protein n=1 Tax=uncultured Alistipes sp. TaxID=538949 RepID=UPI00261CC041|nr:fibronectin type III domain-containing protein [uncultured Alistipes sp.]